jgi:hypothetical protein
MLRIDQRIKKQLFKEIGKKTKNKSDNYLQQWKKNHN